jgi:2'-5' RNA ligase
MRVFTCVWIPEELRAKIKKIQQDMKNLPMKAKFVEVENLHFTISFLGERSSEEITMLKNKLDKSVETVKNFHVKLEGLKTIPNPNFIRVIGVNVKDKDNVANLIKKVADSVGGKYYLEQKVTLCRVKKILDKQEVSNFISANQSIEIGTFLVTKISLVKSTLTKHGPVYKTIHDSYLAQD